jgi:hypothetical protein
VCSGQLLTKENKVTELEKIKEVLNYRPNTGTFTWKVQTGRRVKIGDIAGSLSGNGYRLIRVLGSRYYVHRLVWLFETGGWPLKDVDHINMDPLDNVFSNLRLCDRVQNIANSGLRSTNTTGFKGVTKSRNKFLARITVDYISVHLGSYSTATEAGEVYQCAAREWYGKFYRDI